MSERRLLVEDHLARVEEDLMDLDDQVAAGEIDVDTAARLRATYLAEAERLRAAIGELDPEGPPRGRSPRRTLVGGLILGIGAVVIVATAVASLTDRPPGGNATGGVASEVLGGGGVDLDQVSDERLEEVVAANPEIVPMRMALARRYFEAGAFDAALRHYLVILDEQQVAEPEALANVGWMTALSGRPDVARELVVRALEIEPDFPQAHWFLANIEMELEDPCAALEAVGMVLARDDLPPDVAAEAEQLRQRAEVGCDG